MVKWGRRVNSKRVPAYFWTVKTVGVWKLAKDLGFGASALYSSDSRVRTNGYVYFTLINDLTDQLDWKNPEGDTCPYDLSKPLPLQGSLGHLTILVNFFFNNDLEYLKTGNSEKKYTVSITKTKAARSQINRLSKHEVYSIMKILSMIRVKVDKQIGYGYLEEIVVRRADRKEYTFKKGDFSRLHLNDIKDMLLLHVLNKLFNLPGDDIVNLLIALRMFTRSLFIKKRVEDVQLGVESYQIKLNVTKLQKEFPGILFKESYTTSFDLKGVVYLNLRKRKRLMRADELYKFFDGTLKSIHEILHFRMLNFKLGYMVKKIDNQHQTDMPKRK
ncbi:hypothetical protein Tco_0003814 [Tanacetum coccineum]